jgi:hypothetical protein
MRRRSALWMLAYGVCLVLVLSFILFEVLDVDGSDFASPMRAATAIKVTEPPQDLRRAALHVAPSALVFPPTDRVETLQVQQRFVDASADTSTHPSLRRASRHTLARALIADPLRTA